MTGRTFESFNPANKTQVVGRFQKATEELARLAVESANENVSDVAQHARAASAQTSCFAPRTLMRKRKHELSRVDGIRSFDKTWAEADGDTAEAIDFMEFYGREMLRYWEKQPVTQITGEHNRLEYIPLGVGAIIPPWNFPLAIMAGMTAAAVVTGNTVVLKPSSDAPTIAYKFLELLEEAGFPPASSIS